MKIVLYDSYNKVGLLKDGNVAVVAPSPKE